MKTSDRIFLNLLLLTFLTLLFFYITKVLIAGMFIGYLTWILIRTTIIIINNRYGINKRISIKEMENIFAIWGTTEQTNYFFRLIPSCYSATINENRIEYIKNREKIAIILNYKFSQTSCEDICKIYRDGKRFSKIYCLGKAPARDVIILAGELSLPIEFVPSKMVRRILEKHNSLPKNFFSERNKCPSWKKSLSLSFSADRMKYYFMGTLIFLFYGFFNVHRVWYLSFSALTFLMGCLCLYFSISKRKK